MYIRFDSNGNIYINGKTISFFNLPQVVDNKLVDIDGNHLEDLTTAELEAVQQSVTNLSQQLATVEQSVTDVSSTLAEIPDTEQLGNLTTFLAEFETSNKIGVY